MACLNNLKQEMKTLERLFSKSHELFQIVNASVDELTCRFISKNGKKYDIHANITVSPFLILIFFFSLFFHFDIFLEKKLLVQWIFGVLCAWKKSKLNAEIPGLMDDDGGKRKRKQNGIGEKHLITTKIFIFLLSSRSARGRWGCRKELYRLKLPKKKGNNHLAHHKFSFCC